MTSVCRDELAKKLSICGQVAEHKSSKMQEHGVDDSEILSALSEEEKQQLDQILTKLQKAFIEDHKAHHAH